MIGLKTNAFFANGSPFANYEIISLEFRHILKVYLLHQSVGGYKRQWNTKGMK